MIGKYGLAKQVGKWGYYGVVTLDATVVAGAAGVQLEFADDIVDWRAGIQFGVAYAYEKSLAMEAHFSGVKVRVLESRGHEVDTTESVMAFVAAHAFSCALGMAAPEGLVLLPEVGRFSFPK